MVFEILLKYRLQNILNTENMLRKNNKKVLLTVIQKPLKTKEILNSCEYYTINSEL